MAEHVVLLGSEDVARAGHAMASAAADMNRAAGSIEDSLHRHRQFMDEWLNRLEAIIEKSQKDKT